MRYVHVMKFFSPYLRKVKGKQVQNYHENPDTNNEIL